MATIINVSTPMPSLTAATTGESPSSSWRYLIHFKRAVAQSSETATVTMVTATTVTSDGHVHRKASGESTTYSCRSRSSEPPAISIPFVLPIALNGL